MNVGILKLPNLFPATFVTVTPACHGLFFVGSFEVWFVYCVHPVTYCKTPIVSRTTYNTTNKNTKTPNKMSSRSVKSRRFSRFNTDFPNLTLPERFCCSFTVLSITFDERSTKLKRDRHENPTQLRRTSLHMYILHNHNIHTVPSHTYTYTTPQAAHHTPQLNCKHIPSSLKATLLRSAS